MDWSGVSNDGLKWNRSGLISVDFMMHQCSTGLTMPTAEAEGPQNHIKHVFYEQFMHMNC